MLQVDVESIGEEGLMFYSTSHFQHMLRVERKRTERSQKPFLLLLIDISSLMAQETKNDILEKTKSALDASLREVDIRGWYDQGKVIGVIFTELMSTEVTRIEKIVNKVYGRLCQYLLPEWVRMLSISYHVYPENFAMQSTEGTFNTNLYPDLTKRIHNRQISLMIKSISDISLSAVALILFSPLFLAVAAAIKATSKGPVFFRQDRMGMNGKTFQLLKFRSMATNCDAGSHKEYIKKFICEQKSATNEPGVFKLTNDNRITPVGQFLRKTSLDELPQLINVLLGEMSLVGPRPPISYECEIYDIWHRGRLLTCKPGITGLWQVTGRSRTTFDEMVRLDLKYITEWSLWLDIKILLMTPKAVLSGKGAY